MQIASNTTIGCAPQNFNLESKITILKVETYAHFATSEMDGHWKKVQTYLHFYLGPLLLKTAIATLGIHTSQYHIVIIH